MRQRSIRQKMTENYERYFPLYIQKPSNLRNNPELQRRRNRTVYFGTESISSLAPKIWELIPSDIRSANSLGIFKEKIKFWTTDKCPCRLCKKYIDNVGLT